jgi:hypothetical protein
MLRRSAIAHSTQSGAGKTASEFSASRLRMPGTKKRPEPSIATVSLFSGSVVPPAFEIATMRADGIRGTLTVRKRLLLHKKISYQWKGNSPNPGARGARSHGEDAAHLRVSEHNAVRQECSDSAPFTQTTVAKKHAAVGVAADDASVLQLRPTAAPDHAGHPGMHMQLAIGIAAKGRVEFEPT